jgi:hypothetical protein
MRAWANGPGQDSPNFPAPTGRNNPEAFHYAEMCGDYFAPLGLGPMPLTWAVGPGFYILPRWG